MAKKTFGGSSSFGDTWKPNVDKDGNRREIFDPKTDFIEGYLIAAEEKSFGSNDKPTWIYTFEIAQDPAANEDYAGFGAEGSKVSTFGGKVLDEKIAEAIKEYGMGCWLRVEWLGMKLRKPAQQIKDKNPNKVMQNSDYSKLYKVVGDDSIPPIKVEGQTSYQSTASNTAPTQKQSAPATQAPTLPTSLGDENEFENDPAPPTTNTFAEKPEQEPAPVPEDTWDDVPDDEDIKF